MTKTYYCWLPELGERRVAALYFMADDFEEAAEKAAREFCQRDVKWRNHIVSVAHGHRVKRFNVEMRSEPVFVAHPLTATI